MIILKTNLIALICLLVFCVTLQAGLANLTFHSRANCGNNETISWHLGHSYLLRTISRHFYKGIYQHTIDTGREVTWRSAAVHWGEGTGGWRVEGEHWGVNQLNHDFLLRVETVYDCSIYDGWWNH